MRVYVVVHIICCLLIIPIVHLMLSYIDEPCLSLFWKEIGISAGVILAFLLGSVDGASYMGHKDTGTTVWSRWVKATQSGGEEK